MGRCADAPVRRRDDRAASTTLLSDSRAGSRGGFLPWLLLVIGSAASLAANVAVAEPTITGRVIAAWPSFSLIAAYELLMRQVRRVAESPASELLTWRSVGPAAKVALVSASERISASEAVVPERKTAGRDVRREAWRWAQDNRAEDGSLPSGTDIGSRYGRHERWGQTRAMRPRCARS